MPGLPARGFMLLLLVLLQLLRPITGATRHNLDQEILTEWVNIIRWMEYGSTTFDLMPGDSLSLDCRGMSHMRKIRAPLDLEWRLLDRPLLDEGPHGRVRQMDNAGRLTVENVNERDSGLYATYTRAERLSHILGDVKLPTWQQNSSDTVLRDIEEDTSTADLVAMCLFIVRVEARRSFATREGQNFLVNPNTWLRPFAATLTVLNLPHHEWSLAWYLNGENKVSCNRLYDCKLKLHVSREIQGVWSLELRSLVYASGQRRVLLDLRMTVRPSLSYLEGFALESHQYYVVYATLMTALALLSLHLFNNLNWTPFAFDVLPDEVSPKAVLDRAGVFLKESRV